LHGSYNSTWLRIKFFESNGTVFAIVHLLCWSTCVFCGFTSKNWIKVMPRFFFNLEDHERLLDDEGTELPGTNEARIEAVKFAGEYLQDNPQLLADETQFRVVVEDENRTMILRIVMKAEIL
jgi:hypothetical protein